MMFLSRLVVSLYNCIAPCVCHMLKSHYSVAHALLKLVVDATLDGQVLALTLFGMIHKPILSWSGKGYP